MGLCSSALEKWMGVWPWQRRHGNVVQSSVVIATSPSLFQREGGKEAMTSALLSLRLVESSWEAEEC